MAPVDKLHSSHVIDGSLTDQQVKQAILVGAADAGWRAKDLGNDKILASFSFKTHGVNVEIDYTGSSYSTHYESSYGMKTFCTEHDKKTYKTIVSGKADCPDYRPPAYIYMSYKNWVDSLDRSIQSSLAAM